MQIQIDFNFKTKKGVLIASNDISEFDWRDIKNTLINSDEGSNILGEDKNEIFVDWFKLMEKYDSIKEFCISKNIGFESKNKEVKNKIYNFFKKKKELNEKPKIKISKDKFKKELENLKFSRDLFEYQERDLEKLLSMEHGANFSVPGAGKTTVTLALHSTQFEKNDVLFVCSPMNAFISWDKALKDCLPSYKDNFFRIRPGSKINFFKNINNVPKFLITNYESLQNEYIRDFLSQLFYRLKENKRKIHLVLDESHKIKNPDAEKTVNVTFLRDILQDIEGDRKDILSGTPNPNGINDLVTQMNFLYPGNDIGKTVRLMPHHFVRTTKKDLNLKDYKAIMQPKIQMEEAQAALYKLCSDEFFAKITLNQGNLRNIARRNFSKFKRSVIRLNQIASNPLLLVDSLELEDIDNDPNEFLYSEEAQNIIEEIAQKNKVPKIDKAVDLAEELSKKNKKCVIWTYFVGTIKLLEKKLKHLGALSIYGDVKIGDLKDPNSREYRIAKFNDIKSNCKVLIANYAGCAEGIDLHEACDNAIYIDRDFNAVHYQQSVDRIHRIGSNNPKFLYILQSAVPIGCANIDTCVQDSLHRKISRMAQVLNDENLEESSTKVNNMLSYENDVDTAFEESDLIRILENIIGKKKS